MKLNTITTNTKNTIVFFEDSYGGLNLNFLYNLSVVALTVKISVH